MTKKNIYPSPWKYVKFLFVCVFFRGGGDGGVGEWVDKDQITLSRRRPLGSLAYGSNSDGSWWPLVELGDWTSSYHLSLWWRKLKITHSRRQHDDKHDNTMALTLAAIPVGFASICHFSYGRIPPTQKRILLELSFFFFFCLGIFVVVWKSCSA